MKKGVPDVLAAARSILSDWNLGKIKYCTQPPKDDQSHVHISASIVHTESKEFDVNNFETVVETSILNNFDVKTDEVMELATGVPVEMDEDPNEVSTATSSSKVILEDKIPSTSKVERKCSGGRLNVKEFNMKTDPTMQLEGILLSLLLLLFLFQMAQIHHVNNVVSVICQEIKPLIEI